MLDATRHAGLPAFTDAMRLFVPPLTAVTLLVLLAPSVRRRTDSNTPR